MSNFSHRNPNKNVSKSNNICSKTAVYSPDLARLCVCVVCCLDGNVKVLGVACLYCPQDGGC